MNLTNLDFLFKIEQPWIYIGYGESERNEYAPTYFYNRNNMKVCVRNLRGNKMKTTLSLMNEFGAAMQLCDDFKETWSSLFESLTCLDEWLPADAYILVIEKAEELLINETLELSIVTDKNGVLLRNEYSAQISELFKTLHAVGEFWKQPINNSKFNNRPAYKKKVYYEKVFVV